MKTKKFYKTFSLLLACSQPVAAAPVDAINGMSHQQKIYLDTQIATHLHDPEQRNLVKQWPTAKQLVEFICKPVALSAVRKKYPDAEKIIFLTQEWDSHELSPKAAVTGTAQYRTGVDWHEIQYTCTLNTNGSTDEFSVN